MKTNYVIALILALISFLLLGGAIVLEIMDKEVFCTYAGMASTSAAFFAIVFGLNSWSEK